MGYEYVLCAHMDGTYDRATRARMINITNPVDWMAEYHARGFMEHDPVRAEMERRLADGEQCGVIRWDSIERPTSAIVAEIIERRRAWGLKYGFSAFCNSARHEALFVISFGSSTRIPDDRSALLAKMVVPHVARCRKRLDLQVRVRSLTEREVAVARWLVDGKTNMEIARELAVSTSTVKYHVANILEKLGVRNRQNAINILIAERYLA
jgi:DNA-binding CsgD family transcriptional regulator